MQTDEMEPPNKRKKAVMACNYCRKRKRKCDGRQPMCTLCEEANIPECEYRDRDGSNSTTAQVGYILERVKALEESFASLRDEMRDSSHASPREATPTAAAPIVTPHDSDNIRQESHSPYAASLTSTAHLSHAPSHPHSTHSAYDQQHHADSSVPAALSTPATLPPAEDQPHMNGSGSEFTPMLIPPSHSTTTSSLLRCRPVHDLLGDYPPDLFLHIEKRRSLPPELRLGGTTPAEFPPVYRADADNLTRAYFDLVNQLHPVLDESDFWVSAYGPTMEAGFQFHRDATSALVLVTLALGSAASELPTQASSGFAAGVDPSWMPGIQYMSAALSILVEEALASLGTSLELTQALYLAALYYAYLARPLQAWRLVHMASTDLQHYWNRQPDSKTGSPGRHQSIVRLSWAIFVLECDIIAEHHLPRSGIEHVVEKLPFPSDGYNDSLEPAMLRWLADLSARRLLNRIHHVLYDDSKKFANGDSRVAGESSGVRDLQPSLHALSQELDHQLHAWYNLLPASIKPAIAPNLRPNPCIAEAVTMLRYYASGDIIYRPFLLHVCSMAEGETVPGYVVDNANKCLFYCRGYITAVEYTVQASTASLEIFLHSTLAVTILMTLASLSPVLSSAVNDIDAIQQRAMAIFDLWKFPGSSIDTMYSILQTLRIKCIGRL